ncbi:hypothetical protein ACEE67_00880 [Streptococcus thoraltensis]
MPWKIAVFYSDYISEFLQIQIHFSETVVFSIQSFNGRKYLQNQVFKADKEI